MKEIVLQIRADSLLFKRDVYPLSLEACVDTRRRHEKRLYEGLYGSVSSLVITPLSKAGE